MPTLPDCPKCDSEYSYQNGSLLICPACAFEWPMQNAIVTVLPASVHDANSNALQDGATVTLIKDLKVKSSPLFVKVGTKVKNIHPIDGDHNINWKIDGIGAMKLKSKFVKKFDPVAVCGSGD